MSIDIATMRENGKDMKEDVKTAAIKNTENNK